MKKVFRPTLNPKLSYGVQKEIQLPGEKLLQNNPKQLIESVTAVQMRRSPQQETNDPRKKPYLSVHFKLAWNGFVIQIHSS